MQKSQLLLELPTHTTFVDFTITDPDTLELLFHFSGDPSPSRNQWNVPLKDGNYIFAGSLTRSIEAAEVSHFRRTLSVTNKDHKIVLSLKN